MLHYSFRLNLLLDLPRRTIGNTNLPPNKASALRFFLLSFCRMRQSRKNNNAWHTLSLHLQSIFTKVVSFDLCKNPVREAPLSSFYSKQTGTGRVRHAEIRSLPLPFPLTISAGQICNLHRYIKDFNQCPNQ